MQDQSSHSTPSPGGHHPHPHSMEALCLCLGKLIFGAHQALELSLGRAAGMQKLVVAFCEVPWKMKPKVI